MRIAMFSFHTCPLASEEGKESGGMNVYVLNLALELSKQKIYVDVFTRIQDEKSAKIVQINPYLRVIHLKAGQEDTVPKKQLINHLDEFVKNYLEFTKKMPSYDIFHCHYYLSGLIGLKIKEYTKIKTPLIMTFHTLSLMKNLVARTDEEQEEKSRTDAEMKLVKEADIILTPSENDREYLKYFYEADSHKIKIVSPGYDAKLFKPMDKIAAREKIHADPDHKIVLYVGRIEPLKGLDVLMYAMKILVSKMEADRHRSLSLQKNVGGDFYVAPPCPICLWIVGGDIREKDTSLWSGELQKLEELRSTLNIKTIVKFVGQKKQHELADYYNSADAVVMPSHYESFGIAALEAMACAVPVVTTNVTGISYILDKKHKNLVTSANNPLLLAETIKKILESEEKNPTLGITIREKVKDLTWTKTAEKIQEIYAQIVADNSSLPIIPASGGNPGF